MSIRLYNVLRSGVAGVSRHFMGLPPGLCDRPSERHRLPWPRFLVLEQTGEGFFLYRCTEDGQFAGDTFHMTVEEALAQADGEYGAALGQWIEIPADVADAVAYAKECTTRG